MTWEKLPKWPYSDSVTEDTYRLKIGSGFVLLRDAPNFPFTCSFGPNSDRSYSGCFYGLNVSSLDEAKRVILDHATDIGRCIIFTNNLPRRSLSV